MTRIVCGSGSILSAATETTHGVMQPNTARELRTAYAEIALGFSAVPTRAELEQTLKSDDRSEGYCTRQLLKEVETTRFGTDLIRLHFSVVRPSHSLASPARRLESGSLLPPA